MYCRGKTSLEASLGPNARHRVQQVQFLRFNDKSGGVQTNPTEQVKSKQRKYKNTKPNPKGKNPNIHRNRQGKQETTQQDRRGHKTEHDKLLRQGPN